MVKLTVCELRTENEKDFEQDWSRLKDHVNENETDVLLLPEMPFHEWVCSEEMPDQSSWEDSVKKHDHFINKRLLNEWNNENRKQDLVIVSTQPVSLKSTTGDNGNGEQATTSTTRNFNSAFVYSRRIRSTEDEEGYDCKHVHDKYYLPNEPGVYEANWYSRNTKDFSTFKVMEECNEEVNSRAVKGGVLICSELWFQEHARKYGKDGAHIIFTPRATSPTSLDRWVMAGQTAAIASGCYSASSNRYNTDQFGGRGWIIDCEGEVMGVTSQEKPFLTLELDMNKAEEAKKGYPRYIPE